MKYVCLIVGLFCKPTVQTKPTIQSLKCTPHLDPGQSGTCIITISKAAQNGGMAFAISLKGSGLIFPPTVTVPKGKTTATFTIKNASTAQAHL